MIDIIGPKSIKEIKQEIEEKYHVELRSIGDDRYTLYKVGNEKILRGLDHNIFINNLGF